MYSLKKIGLFIKKHFPVLYGKVRTLFAPIYFGIKARKSSGFTKRTNVRVSHAGHTFSIVIDPANGFVDTEIFSAGVYEPDILSVIKKNLPEDGVYVDIGANIGQHTLFAACHLRQNGKVIAFEPIPRLVTQIKESIALNKLTNITVHQLACSNSTSVFELKINPGNIGGSGFHHTDEQFETISVRTTPADTLLADEQRIDFIKIDTEGHELDVLQGLAQTLEKHAPTLLLEYSPSFWREDRQRKTTEFFGILTQYNYTCYDLENGHSRIENLETWSTNFSKIQTNLLCIPRK